MIAKMRIANITRSPICISGANAFRMDLRTTCKPKEKKYFKNHVYVYCVYPLFYGVTITTLNFGD